MDISNLCGQSRCVNVPILHTYARRTQATAMLALLLANVIWAGSSTASKALIVQMPPLVMSSLRMAIAMVVLLALLHRRHEQIATGRAPAILGVTGVGLFLTCQNVGLLVADATTTALLGASTPILTIILGASLLRERVGAGQLLGSGVTLAGVGMIMVLETGEMGNLAMLGNLLPFASAVCFAVYNVVGRAAFSSGHALPLVAGGARYGLIFLLPLTILEMTRTSPSGIDAQDVTLLLYLGVGCSVVAFLLSGYGLAHIGAAQSGLYGYLKPTVGVMLAVTLLGEPLGSFQIAGGLLVLLGIGIASRSWLHQPGGSAPLEPGGHDVDTFGAQWLMVRNRDI